MPPTARPEAECERPPDDISAAASLRDNPTVPDDRDCLSCINNARLDLPPRERVYVSSTWRVAHAFGTALTGWMVVLPRRHVIALDELTPAEAADLGPLLTGLTSALRQVVGCDKTYVALFAEAEGFQHIHFHVVPRHPDLDAGFRGPRVFGLLGGDPDRYVPDGVMDQIATSIGRVLPSRSA
jgi:diadenosine tetraphosphate (Ap4A) HIT family hydrolase